MNNLSYINNMGLNKMSDIDIKTIKRFKEYNPELTKGLSDREILSSFSGSASFALIALSLAFGGVGYAVKEAAIKGEKEDSFLRKIYNRIIK